nr:MAG TPA: BppU domain protein [Caudoviricetes sp.]
MARNQDRARQPDPHRSEPVRSDVRAERGRRGLLSTRGLYMASNWTIEQDVDLRCGAQTPQIWPNALMLTGDNLAHTWRVRVFDGGEAVALTGATVTGYFVRTDGNTVAVQGSVEGSTAIVTLAQACYAFEGDLKGVMRLTLGGKTVTLSVLTLMVRKVLTDAIIDPGNVIPSLEDLLAQIEAMETATAAEQGRVAAEQERASAETARETAEAARRAALGGLSFAVNEDDGGLDITYTYTETEG